MRTLFPAAHRRSRSAKPFAAPRRRASVLILVMAVLGVLFVTGIAFMATMNWQWQMVEREQQARAYELGVAQIETVIDNVLREQFVRSGGRSTPSDELTTVVQTYLPMWNQDPFLPPTRNEYRFNTPSFSLGYGPNALISQVEPQQPKVPKGSFFQFPDPMDENHPDNQNLDRRDRQFVYQNFTDLEVLINGPQYLSAGRIVRPIDPDAPLFPEFEGEGVNPLGRRIVDADGDGINDTWEIDLASIGISGDAIRELAKVVNPAENPNGKVRAGLRVVPHGAFVNLNQSHPLMINNVFSANNNLWVASAYDERRNFPYFSDIEEPSLRHRGFLPQFKIPQSGIQGSSLLDPDLDPLGDGDFSSQLFSVPTRHFPNGESVFDFKHRYWMFSANEAPDGMLDSDLPPFVPLMDRNKVIYDRRSLVTTVSHDDLLSRGAMFNNQDVVSLMRQVNLNLPQAQACDPVFEYPNYPLTLENDITNGAVICQCMDDNRCISDPRKGRLQMSLPWLESGLLQEYPAIPGDNWNRRRIRQKLVHETFMQLLLRARSPEFGSFAQQGNQEGEWTRNSADNPNVSLIGNVEIAAASLTANLLDYADADDIPTAIVKRKVDFAAADVGRPVSYPAVPTSRDYVFGVEEQPFITELVSRITSVGDNPDFSAGSSTFYALELYNPYEDDLVLDGYSLRIWDHKNSGIVTTVYLPPVTLPPRNFTYFYSGNQSGMNLQTTGHDIGQDFVIPRPGEGSGEESVVYLVRTIQGVQNYAGQPQTFEIVVDQFSLGDGCNVGRRDLPMTDVYSTQRVVRGYPSSFPTKTFPWTAPVPIECAENEFHNVHTLGLYNEVQLGLAEIPRPVNVSLANTVNFDNADEEMGSAFPTTGSILLITRYANRAWDDSLKGESLAFTAFLDHPSEIDNGRLPVFDKANNDRISANDDPTNPTVPPNLLDPYQPWPQDRPGELYHLPWGQMIFDYFTALPLLNKGPFEVAIENNMPVVQNAQPKVDMEGLRVHGRINIDVAPWKAMQGTPKMPLSAFSGLSTEVQNTIAIFAQLDPMNATPIGEDLAKAIVAYREAREICEPLQTDNTNECSDTTGDYHGDLVGANMQGGRGWDSMNPQFRRGTGFLTVGELANVISDGAYIPPTPTPPTFQQDLNDRQFNDFSPYRMDSGVLNWTSQGSGSAGYNFYQDYVAAVANLVALGDWVTVKSHVFTVYAIIRGEPVDSAINPDSEQERDDRALRLQETVDRLPVFLGEQKPTQIGERTLGLYKDVQNN